LPATTSLIVLFGLWLFAVGTVVGSFLNVCIYRIPWQKSVIWPGSHCPKCWNAIPARDNIPIVGWLALGGRCRSCRGSISVRYPLVEALVGLLFVALFAIDVIHGPRAWRGEIPSWLFAPWFYHAILIALLVAGTFMDYDLTVIPDEVTVTGMLLGLSLGTLFPWIRAEPATASTHMAGFWAGMTGLLVGAGLTGSVRFLGSVALRREAMGLGDVTLMAMIGSFLGWQAAVLTFFLAPFFGLVHALWKMFKYIIKRLTGGQLSSTDREIPFGPYLSMAAVALVLSWPRLWAGWGASFFGALRAVCLWLIGLEK
jgi:leader peptidase (prepilin peptidase) / N-methyltransferase